MSGLGTTVRAGDRPEQRCTRVLEGRRPGRAGERSSETAQDRPEEPEHTRAGLGQSGRRVLGHTRAEEQVGRKRRVQGHRLAGQVERRMVRNKGQARAHRRERPGRKIGLPERCHRQVRMAAHKTAGPAVRRKTGQLAGRKPEQRSIDRKFERRLLGRRRQLGPLRRRHRRY